MKKSIIYLFLALLMTISASANMLQSEEEPFNVIRRETNSKALRMDACYQKIRTRANDVIKVSMRRPKKFQVDCKVLCWIGQGGSVCRCNFSAFVGK